MVHYGKGLGKLFPSERGQVDFMVQLFESIPVKFSRLTLFSFFPELGFFELWFFPELGIFCGKTASEFPSFIDTFFEKMSFAGLLFSFFSNHKTWHWKQLRNSNVTMQMSLLQISENQIMFTDLFCVKISQ